MSPHGSKFTEHLKLNKKIDNAKILILDLHLKRIVQI